MRAALRSGDRRNRLRRIHCPGSCPSSVRRVLRARGGDLRLEAVADREQLLLVHDVLAALLEVVFVDGGLDDRVDRAALLAETAEDGLEQVDVVARGAARGVLARRRVESV